MIGKQGSSASGIRRALHVCGSLCPTPLGYPVALTLAGTSLIAALLGVITGHFDLIFLNALPNRLFGIMTNQTLMAVPLFVLMGVILERSKIAEDLLDAMTRAFGRAPGGLGLAVCLVGMLMAASTGIVGATVVTMGLMALPTMLKAGYSPSWQPAPSAQPARSAKLFRLLSHWFYLATSSRARTSSLSSRLAYLTRDQFRWATCLLAP